MVHLQIPLCSLGVATNGEEEKKRSLGSCGAHKLFNWIWAGLTHVIGSFTPLDGVSLSKD